MICYVDGVELLIFTSKQLDEDSQSELSGFLNSIPSSFIVEEGIKDGCLDFGSLFLVM